MCPLLHPTTRLIPVLAALLVLPGCGKGAVPAPGGEEEVKLYLWPAAGTRAQAVTGLSALWWGTTTGGNAAGSGPESVEWSEVDGSALWGSLSDGILFTGHYVNASAPGVRNYYAANVPFTLGEAPALDAFNDTDIVAGRTFGCSELSPSVSLGHIFARLGTLTMAPQEGYAISEVSWTICGETPPYGTAGTYDLRDGSWSGCSGLESALPVNSGSDLYLIPGSYTLCCTYTLSRYGQSQTLSASASVSLDAGYIHHVSATAVGGSLNDLTVTVNCSIWDSWENAGETNLD